MNTLEEILLSDIFKAVKTLYSHDINNEIVQLQKTRKEFSGDITLVVFPLLKFSHKPPEQTAEDIGRYLIENSGVVSGYNVIKGFLNLEISNDYWLKFLNNIIQTDNYGLLPEGSSGKTIMVEYSSPNTNKPLHLGHIRNNLIGYSVANILKAQGHKVIKVNLVNDRGIHICKSMLAWQKWGEGITPEKAGIKGDHLVGDFYVKFDKEYKSQVSLLLSEGMKEEEAMSNAPLIKEAQEMLRQWEAGDENIISLWKMMNQWVYDGFKETYNKLGVDFDRIYYESETYLLGKAIILEGLEKGLLYQKPDGSIWADLTADGLDQKVLLRSDGTSVYMTQVCWNSPSAFYRISY